MLNTRRHNPLLQNRLESLALSGNYDALISFLSRLSVADFRTSGILLAEEVLPKLPNDFFWACFGEVVASNPKAYLMTFLKAAVKGETIRSMRNNAFKNYLENNAGAIDKRKIRETMLPHIENADDFYYLLSLTTNDTPAERIECLIKIGTPTACYLLFCEARRIEDDTNALRSYCLQLMKKGNKISFNLASIMQQYFSIENLPGTFSLRLKPYELSRLNESFENFKSILMK